MKKDLIEKVATENAATIMAERIIDLLTNNTRIMDFVDSIGDIEVTTDFENGFVKVKIDSFVITYLVNYGTFVEFKTESPYGKTELSILCEILNYDEEVNNMFHSVMSKITIREYYEKHKVYDGLGVYTADIDHFLWAADAEEFYNLVEKDEDWIFYINEDVDGNLFVTGNESCLKTYFNDNTPMVLVYGCLMNKMNEEILKIETEIETEIEKESKYKVLDAFECGGDFKVDYDEWWDYVLGETNEWIKDKYYGKFCDVLYGYFEEYAEDYGYDVKEVDGGLDLEKK